MTREEVELVIAEIARLWPRWRHAEAPAYVERVSRPFAEFDYAETVEVIHHERDMDLDGEKPPLNIIVRALRTAGMRRNAGELDADGYWVRNVRGGFLTGGYNLTEMTDLEVFRLYHYTHGAWQTSYMGTVIENPRMPNIQFRGEWYSPNDDDRRNLCDRMQHHGAKAPERHYEQRSANAWNLK